MLRRFSILLLTLLAFLLPFELEEAWLNVGPVALTNVELVLGTVLVVAAVGWWRAGPRWPRAPLSWGVLGILFIAGLFLSALLAPSFRMNALKAALRTLSGIGLALAVGVTLRGRRDVRWLAVGLVGGGLIAAVIGLAEIAYGTDMAWLAILRPGPTVAGPFLRLSGPFDYANQAGMFIEATAPLLLALTWQVKQRGARLWWLLAGALLLYVLGAIFTFSRATMAGLIVVSGVLALLLWLRGGDDRRRMARALAVLGGCAFLLASVSYFLNSNFRMRFLGESDTAWYRAQIEAPPSLALPAAGQRRVTVTLTNEGAFTWRSEGATPVHLAGRWVHTESDLQLRRQSRWVLPGAVAPGDRVTMEVVLWAPEMGGAYRLYWDLVQEGVAWFSVKTGRETSSIVTVTGSSGEAAQEGGEGVGAGSDFEASWEIGGPIPGRRTLWTAAWRLWRERPILGIGLDNFRLRYGDVIGYSTWNTTIHTNNWYVQTAVSVGLLGFVPFLAWLGLLALDGLRLLWRGQITMWHVAVAAGLFTYLIHGLLDYFLLFNATALLFWFLVGLWVFLAHGSANQLSR